MECARRAGELLLKIKAVLPHGEFLPWLENHVAVSARQAQRYMAVAVGKMLPVRNTALLKNDTVSHLNWLPANGHLADVILATGIDGSRDEWLLVQEVGHAAGFFHIAYFDSSIIHWLKRGISANYVEDVILDLLPGRYTRKTSVSELNWAYFDSPDWLHDNVIKTFGEMEADDGR